MKQPAPKNVYDFVTFKLDRLNDLIKGYASRLYLEKFDLSIRDLRILRLTELHPGLNMGRLCELSMIEKTITSKLVTALCERDYLQRTIDSTDARRLNLELTAKGHAMVKESYRYSTELEMKFLERSPLSDAELDEFMLSIEKLTVFMEKTIETEGFSQSGGDAHSS